MTWRVLILLGLSVAFFVAKRPDLLHLQKSQPPRQEQIGGATSPLTSPSPERPIEKKRQIIDQERHVHDLELRLKKGDAELSELDKRMEKQDELEKQEAVGEIQEQQLTDARVTLQELQRQQEQQVGELRLKYGLEEVAVRERKANQENTLAQLKEQLKKEEATAAHLHRKLQQLLGLNIETDLLRSTREQTQIQDARAAQVRTQVLDFQTQIARQEAAERINLEQRKLQENTAVSINIGAEIQAAQKRIQALEQARNPTPKGGSAGEAGIESVKDRYMEKKREQDLLRSEYETQKIELERLKGETF